MDFPATFEGKCDRLKALFQDGIFSTLEANPAFIRVWETCIRHPLFDFKLEATLVFGQRAKAEALRQSFGQLHEFARKLTEQNWSFRSHELSVLRDLVHKTRADPFLVVLVVAAPKSTALVHTPRHQSSNKKLELSPNDKRFLRSLRITWENPQESEVE